MEAEGSGQRRYSGTAESVTRGSGDPQEAVVTGITRVLSSRWSRRSPRARPLQRSSTPRCQPRRLRSSSSGGRRGRGSLQKSNNWPQFPRGSFMEITLANAAARLRPDLIVRTSGLELVVWPVVVSREPRCVPETPARGEAVIRDGRVRKGTRATRRRRASG